MNNKVAIIGSGIAGIATSIRLKAKGFDVTVYEKNSFPGGKLSSFKLGEFRFDMDRFILKRPAPDCDHPIANARPKGGQGNVNIAVILPSGKTTAD